MDVKIPSSNDCIDLFYRGGDYAAGHRLTNHGCRAADDFI